MCWAVVLSFVSSWELQGLWLPRLWEPPQPCLTGEASGDREGEVSGLDSWSPYAALCISREGEPTTNFFIQGQACSRCSINACWRMGLPPGPSTPPRIRKESEMRAEWAHFKSLRKIIPLHFGPYNHGPSDGYCSLPPFYCR